jgi:hypothetical protein
MILRNRFTGLSIILVIGVLLSGCSLTGQAAAPTVDPKALQATVDAAVARSMQTEAFNLTSTAAALPTNTFTVTSTLAPLATATPKATATAAATATATATHPAPTATKALIASTTKPTATATPAAYVCKLISTTPTKGTKVNTNTDFDAVWTVKNVGIKGWQVGYVDLKYISGTKMQTVADLFDVKTAVMKGEELVLTVDMKAPTTAGKFTDTFALMMEGTTMCTLPVTIEAVTP